MTRIFSTDCLSFPDIDKVWFKRLWKYKKKAEKTEKMEFKT